MSNTVTFKFDLHDRKHREALGKVLNMLKSSGFTDCISVVTSVEQLSDMLADNRERHAYECQDGYAISHGGGRVSRDVIDAAERKGLIKRRYPDQTINAWDSAL
jgi:hypothetical protein